MLLSWRLWRASFHNSLYNFPLLMKSPNGLDSHWIKVTPLLRKVRIGLIVFGLIYILVVQPAALSMLLAVCFVLLVLLAGTVSGWAAALRIAGAIFREQEERTLRTAAADPAGCAGCALGDCDALSAR